MPFLRIVKASGNDTRNHGEYTIEEEKSASIVVGATLVVARHRLPSRQWSLCSTIDISIRGNRRVAGDHEGRPYITRG
jgi:hypothetical protein